MKNEVSSSSWQLAAGSRLFLLMFLLMFSFTSFAQKRQDLEKEREKLKQEIENTKKLLEETSANKQASQGQLETLRSQIRLREKVIGNINKEMGMIDEQMDETTAIIAALEKDLVDLKKEYAAMLVNMYKNRSSLNQLIFIFNAESFNDAFARVRYLQQFGEFREKQAEVIEKTKETLERKRQEQIARKNDKLKLLDAEQGQRAKLSDEIKQQNTLLASLKDKEGELRKIIEKKQKDAATLNNKIKEIIDRELKAAQQQKITNAAGAAGAVKLSANFASNQGRLPWPVERGVICEPFGEHNHAVVPNLKVVNNGVDICTGANSQARALFQGTVVTVMYNPGFQRAVMLKHGDYFTVYTNLKEVFVRPGDEVTVKQPIGLVYTDEKAGDSKVHLELWKGNQKLNPALWMYPNNQ